MNLSKEEERIKNIIEKYSRDQYDHVISSEEWPVFQELTSLRENLLSWYPFENGAKVLECAEGFGALTGILSQKCEKVVVVAENLFKAECIRKRYVDCSNIDVLNEFPHERNEKFDYVVIDRAISQIDELYSILAEWQPFLGENGKLLLTCWNRFSAREFCGAPSQGMLPFERIRNEKGATYQGIIHCLENMIWIDSWKIYYPFPDHILPQAIYTDEYLPKKSVRDRIISYYTDEQRKSLLMLEDEIYDGLIENGVFNVLANSFLIECSKEKLSDYVVYAVLSKDRGKEHGFSTMITHAGQVIKAALDPAGRDNLVRIYQNSLALMNRGIKCIPMELGANYLSMPYIKGNTLIEYLEECFVNKRDMVSLIFDLLYKDILNSSDHVQDGACSIKNVDTEQGDFGVILERAYIDMIPYNSFYLDGNLYFFDQEFVFYNYPAKYVLFRAIRYTYIYIKKAEDIIPIQFFKDKYALNEVWHLFEQEEARFIQDNRNYSTLNCFYNWANVANSLPEKNIRKLSAVDDVKNEIKYKRRERGLDKYYRDIALNKIKAVQLNLLRNFQRICEENNLSYCAFYGTLLGVVRHGGMIPWDDDMDILMPRADYDKLVKIADIVFPTPLFLQTPENDQQCFYGGYCKLRDSNTAGLESRNAGHMCNQGIWIDIFPLDYVPENQEEKSEQLEKIRMYQRMIFAKVYPERAEWKTYDNDRFTLKELYQILHDTMTEVKEDRTDKVAVLARYYNGQWYSEYDVSDFEFLIKRKFEDGDIYVPVGYEHCLKVDYGDDYMIYPQEDERCRHHNAVYATDISYREWSEKSKKCQI